LGAALVLTPAQRAEGNCGNCGKIGVGDAALGA
jgi:hypothetical protein